MVIWYGEYYTKIAFTAVLYAKNIKLIISVYKYSDIYRKMKFLVQEQQILNGTDEILISFPGVER